MLKEQFRSANQLLDIRRHKEEAVAVVRQSVLAQSLGGQEGRNPDLDACQLSASVPTLRSVTSPHEGRIRLAQRTQVGCSQLIV